MRYLVNHESNLLRTFRYHDLIFEQHLEVYDPAEDSFLLLDSLQIKPHDMVLELGTGCGLIALECAHKGAQVLCTDINPFAVQLTRHNIDRNRHLLKGDVEIRQGDLFTVLEKTELFNVIIFNPPYLPTRNKEKIGGWFDIATDGGRDGLKLTKRFLAGLQNHLLRRGVAYFIFSSLSKRSMLEQHLQKEQLAASIIACYKSDNEELDVYRVSPTA